ncbi:MAG: hypothetical protein HY607_10535 [Planctomycetes bacterium]|uniref:pPIWI-associating nuclease domain-containing protein n=1 Tax=Candidatus Wunengus californicus TaxID=3367619 RepID=UPI00402693D5|nr:hypothetical protein [Planctomycetota bacterium]MBI4223099.1 hypothetical protein [Planctomycetota bacterium]
MDWYKKHLELTKSYSWAFDQFKRFEDLYGNSFHRIAKDILAQEEIIKKSVTPFYSFYSDIISSLQPEIERIRELHLSSPILDAINQANSGLASLFAEQSTLAKLAEEATSINRFWQTEIESAKHLASGVEAAKLALHSHFDDMAQASLLAQERLLNSPWRNLERSILSKTNELSSALNSFNIFTESYNSLIQSFNTKEFNIIDFPPFVSGLPPIEILTSSDLLDTISRDETEEYVEESDALEAKIREDIEISLEELLGNINPKIRRLWQGAKAALSSTNPDKKRHVVVSLREMLTYILHSIAPDSEISKWTSKPSHFHEGRPPREARLLYICRDINHGPFEQFVNRDVDAHVKFIHLFQRGTHELNINFTEQQLRTLVVRTESLVRFLLITWKNTK